MKQAIYITILSFIGHLSLTGCSCSTDNDTQSSVAHDIPTPYDKPSKAFDRGQAEARRINNIEDEATRQRAIVELHGLVSALERNGFPVTAEEFSKGLNSVLDGK